jgi:phospholipid-binding lipoprotein MlaA
MPNLRYRSALAGLSLVLLAGLGACASPTGNHAIGPGTPQLAQAQPADTDETYNPNDPLENVNRAIFSFNLFLDDNVLVPVAKGYRTVLPSPVRDGVRNFMDNLKSPVIFVNDVLQGEARRATETFGRFMTNTTVGVGGIFDVAGHFGVRKHSEDFGQTFAVWGIPDCPYLMLPLLGPSNVRDAVGTGIGFYADPLNYYLDDNGLEYVTFIRSAIDAIDARSRNIELFDKIRSTSLDYYAQVRSLYRQRRAAEIRNEDSSAPTANPMSSSALPDDAKPAAPTGE